MSIIAHNHNCKRHAILAYEIKYDGSVICDNLEHVKVLNEMLKTCRTIIEI